MPDKKNFGQNALGVWIFSLYLGLWVGQGIYVALTKTDEKGYKYNTVTAILFSETLKLIISYLCYIKNHSLSSLWHVIRSNTKMLGLYLVPSFLYCSYNNLAFVNLAHYDPTSYFTLLQLRVVVTGICFQIILKKKLNRIQWLALILLTCGCIIQQISLEQIPSLFSFNGGKVEVPFFSPYLLFILIQVFCSCIAGVYIEHLLKETGPNVNVFIQNIFMYLDSILWNVLFLLYQGKLFTIFSSESLEPILQPLVLIIILNTAFIGITTSLFLKNFNSVIKVFASAIELSLTAVLCWIVLGIPIKANTLLAIPIISYSLYVFFTHSEAKQGKSEPEKVKEVEEPLLEEV